MRKIIYIFLLLLSYTAYSQSLSLFNIDASNFPTIRASFFAFDSTENQITNLNPSDFEVKENGMPRVVTNVDCPEQLPIVVLSTVLVMDVSGSMCDGGLDIAKAAANAWINMLPLGKSECAITSFSDENYINQDFTTDKTKLFSAVNRLNCLSGTDYNAAMLNAMAGGVLIAKLGKYKRIIVFLSDGGMNFEPKTAEIIKAANDANITIYCVTILNNAPQCMKDFSNQTGGLYFENIRTEEEAEECYRKILITAEDGSPCQIEWQSEVSCVPALINVEIKLFPNNRKRKISYNTPSDKIAKLEIIPPSLKLKNSIPGKIQDTAITITATNADFNVKNITSSNPAFTITPTNFFLNSGQKQNLTVRYVPADSGYTFTKFTIENDKCMASYFAGGGYPGKKAKIKTLKLIQPNGGETFVVGMDTLITWEGLLPEEKVKIEYTTDSGTNWIEVEDYATGLSYKWIIPKTPSNFCLAKVTVKMGYETGCEVGDVLISNQVWMGCNLDVSTYRDGSPIPEVTDPTEWKNLKTGAWCYYNNDPAIGAIYGKLYNWYAVNDPRGLAPEGWHIPTRTEWIELSDYLGGEYVAGGLMKSTGTIEAGDGLWHSPNIVGTNESGFSAVPGGLRAYDDGLFESFGYRGLWWSSTEFLASGAYCSWLDHSNVRIFIDGYGDYETGLSVRCVRD